MLFLGYEVDEDLPWHSPVSRTRQFFPATIFERLFGHVFSQCVARGLVAGDRQAVDSAPVKANASLEGVVEKQLATSAQPYLAGHDARATPKAPVITAPAYQLRNLAAH